MRKIAIVLASLVVFVRVARASEHEMRINEVLLSNNGDNTEQYVELHDIQATTPIGEPFPTQFGPYTLHVYDADANSLGSVTLSIPQGPPNTVDWFVSTNAADSAFGTTHNTELTVSLPTDGQACFESGVLGKIHCVAWGCVNTLAGTLSNTTRSQSPPDGMSAQRNNATPNHFHVGTPSPQAANTDAAETLPFCATDPDAGPPAPDAAVASPDANAPSPDASGNPGDDTGSSSGCCGVSHGGGSGAALLALATMIAVRRRRATAR